MTRDEAKTVFLNRGYVEVEGGTIYDADKWRESCRVISEWLEQEPCEDTISRQNDILPNIDKKVESYGKLLKHPVVKRIMGIDKEPSENAISRQAVDTLVDELARAISDERCCISRGRSTATIMQDILDLPSVKPQEPQTGHWILKIEDWNKWICSECGHVERTDIHVSLGYGFCPKCGAKMSENPTGSKDVIWYSKRNYSVIVGEPQKRSDKE